MLIFKFKMSVLRLVLHCLPTLQQSINSRVAHNDLDFPFVFFRFSFREKRPSDLIPWLVSLSTCAPTTEMRAQVKFHWVMNKSSYIWPVRLQQNGASSKPATKRIKLSHVSSANWTILGHVAHPVSMVTDIIQLSSQSWKWTTFPSRPFRLVINNTRRFRWSLRRRTRRRHYLQPILTYRELQDTLNAVQCAFEALPRECFVHLWIQAM